MGQSCSTRSHSLVSMEVESMPIGPLARTQGSIFFILVRQMRQRQFIQQHLHALHMAFFNTTRCYGARSRMQETIFASVHKKLHLPSFPCTQGRDSRLMSTKSFKGDP